jgi:hypothetical protein
MVDLPSVIYNLSKFFPFVPLKYSNKKAIISSIKKKYLKTQYNITTFRETLKLLYIIDVKIVNYLVKDEELRTI